MATVEMEKCGPAPSSSDQTGASGAYSNSAIAMMAPGQALPASKEERVLSVKIARAMSSGPREITKDATVAEMGADGKLIILRQGTNDWVCFPGDQNEISNVPMCADPMGSVSAISPFATISGSRAVNDPSATNVAQIVISGTRRSTPGGMSMPAFGSTYTDTEIAAVANYVTGRFGGAASKLTAKDVAQLRDQTGN